MLLGVYLFVSVALVLIVFISSSLFLIPISLQNTIAMP